MDFSTIRIKRHTLENGKEVYMPYTKDSAGHLKFYGIFGTINEAIQWVVDQEPTVLPLEVVSNMVQRTKCVEMRMEMLKFIVDNKLISKALNATLEDSDK